MDKNIHLSKALLKFKANKIHWVRQLGMHFANKNPHQTVLHRKRIANALSTANALSFKHFKKRFKHSKRIVNFFYIEMNKKLSV